MAARLPGIEHQPQAETVLRAALRGRPAHAYLFHGPRGSGKRAAARAFAAALVSASAADPDGAFARVVRGSHPDVTWVMPSGAAGMLVEDIDLAVVQGAALSPLESDRRVFVLDGADLLNEAAANKLLKTVEEPPPGVHLILICDQEQRVLPTLRSRCQPVRFQPLGEQRLVEALVAQGAEPGQAATAARLAEGDREFAEWLLSGRGVEALAAVEDLLHCAQAGRVEEGVWQELLEQARGGGVQAAEAVLSRYAERLETAAPKERSAVERERDELAHRAERRGRLEGLERALRVFEGRLRERWLEAVARGQVGPGGPAWEEALVATAELRLRLAQNVNEQLALEGFFNRLCRLLARR